MDSDAEQMGDEEVEIHGEEMQCVNGSESVFAVDIDPHEEYIASGGQDHVAIIWKVTGEKIFTASKHEDSVTEVKFSPDGQLLATADMAGGICVWKRPPDHHQSEWSLLFHTFDSIGDLSWLDWWRPIGSLPPTGQPNSSILLAGDNSGLVSMWPIGSTSSNRLESATVKVKYFSGKGQSVVGASSLRSLDGHRSPLLLVVYADGQLSLFDVKSTQSVASASLAQPPVVNNRGEEGDVTTSPVVFCLTMAPVNFESNVFNFVAGGQGLLLPFVLRLPTSDVGDAPSLKALAPVNLGQVESVEAVDFAHTHPLLAFGTADGLIGLADSSSFKLRSKWTYVDYAIDPETELGITSLRWSRHCSVFFITSTLGTVTAWSGLLTTSTTATPTPLAVWYGGRAAFHSLALSPRSTVELDHQATTRTPNRIESFLVVGGDDASVNLVSVGKLPQPISDH